MAKNENRTLDSNIKEESTDTRTHIKGTNLELTKVRDETKEQGTAQLKKNDKDEIYYMRSKLLDDIHNEIKRVRNTVDDKINESKSQIKDMALEVVGI